MELRTRAVSALRGASPQPYSKEQLRVYAMVPTPESCTLPRVQLSHRRESQRVPRHTPRLKHEGNKNTSSENLV